MPFGEIAVYKVDGEGHLVSKSGQAIDSPPPNA
jgi:hypothetical protein